MTKSNHTTLIELGILLTSWLRILVRYCSINSIHSLVWWTLLLIYIVTQWLLLRVRGSVKLIIILCITIVWYTSHAYISTVLLRLNCHVANLSASLKISLSHQAVYYYYLLDNPVSGSSFVPTVIAALHPSNRGHEAESSIYSSQ